jgi:tRNA A-37 threonylcarbamoyl transferase component Bud32
MRDDHFASAILRFERDWRRHGPCEIADYLNGPPDSPDRHRLLVELICIDLEFRWRTPAIGEPITLDVYVESFPVLGSLDRLPLELIGEEYRARTLWGDRPSRESFLARFRERRNAIEQALILIDREIADEEAVPLQPPRPASKRTGEWDKLELGVPLASHQDFLLRQMIGAGRMGKVYVAQQHSTGRAVALKFLRQTFLDHPDVVRRFIGEAQTVARLDHPNIVGTQGLGRTPGGAYFIVMDLITGSNLAALMAKRPIPVDEAVEWSIATCSALAHAHERGVVHCDLKPANLLLDERGRIRVTDFGLARSLVGETPSAAEVEGTAPFMAPEQVSRVWGPIDHRTDVYGVGAVLFALLTGRPPIVGRRLPDVLAEVVRGAPVVPPAQLRRDLPALLNEICVRCLAKPPEARFPTVAELGSALAQLRSTGSGLDPA